MIPERPAIAGRFSIAREMGLAFTGIRRAVSLSATAKGSPADMYAA